MKRIDSPVAPLLLAADEHGLCLVEFHTPRHPMPRGQDWSERDHARLQAACVQLEAYFAGTRTRFELSLAPQGTPFQKQVWPTLAGIPYGQIISYAQLAQRVNKPTAMRAVGAANGRNPLPIVLPRHRVIGKDGSLSGFGAGLPTTRLLLQLEGAWPRADDLFA
ncbi:MAG: methylated-DNA--[protein]-cysteine S-methyltransferase [Pseudoxanthomonas sp.]